MSTIINPPPGAPRAAAPHARGPAGIQQNLPPGDHAAPAAGAQSGLMNPDLSGSETTVPPLAPPGTPGRMGTHDNPPPGGGAGAQAAAPVENPPPQAGAESMAGGSPGGPAPGIANPALGDAGKKPETAAKPTAGKRQTKSKPG